MSILVKFRELSRSLKILSIDYKLKKYTRYYWL
jgi:hypothetical protein